MLQRTVGDTDVDSMEDCVCLLSSHVETYCQQLPFFFIPPQKRKMFTSIPFPSPVSKTIKDEEACLYKRLNRRRRKSQAQQQEKEHRRARTHAHTFPGLKQPEVFGHGKASVQRPCSGGCSHHLLLRLHHLLQWVVKLCGSSCRPCRLLFFIYLVGFRLSFGSAEFTRGNEGGLEGSCRWGWCCQAGRRRGDNGSRWVIIHGLHSGKKEAPNSQLKREKIDVWGSPSVGDWSEPAA